MMRAGALFCALLLSACDPRSAAETPQSLETTSLAIERQAGGAVLLKVQIADEPAETEKGLMWVKQMPENHGMLFRFPAAAVQNFWMRNTLIPLDILFIGAEGRILHIHENAAALDETGISSRFPVATVLEVNAGFVAKNGIAVGDIVVVAKLP